MVFIYVSTSTSTHNCEVETKDMKVSQPMYVYQSKLNTSPPLCLFELSRHWLRTPASSRALMSEPVEVEDFQPVCNYWLLKN